MGNSQLDEKQLILSALDGWKGYVPSDRIEKIDYFFERGFSLIWTEYVLWWTLWDGWKDWIDCSHFVAYALWMSDWKMENTWKLDEKYRDFEVDLLKAIPWDLLMWPWHYDPDVKREIGHVEIIVWRYDEWFITLWASWLSRKWNKYNLDGDKLSYYNCVWFSVRKFEPWMRVLRVEDF